MPLVTRVFTIGYQGRSVDGLCRALATAGVQQVVDVRARAWSHRPEFRKMALTEALKKHGIGYVHCKMAGNPYRVTAESNTSLRECRNLYRQHLRSHPDVVATVTELVKDDVSALFCFEAATTSCHRGELVCAIKRSIAIELVDL